MIVTNNQEASGHSAIKEICLGGHRKSQVERVERGHLKGSFVIHSDLG